MSADTIFVRTILDLFEKQRNVYMIVRYGISTLGLLILGACATSQSTSTKGGGFIEELPESVAAIAAPYQNLQAVRLSPEDGCYWYLHDGPVESTMLPLRTTKGNPICTQASTAS